MKLRTIVLNLGMRKVFLNLKIQKPFFKNSTNTIKVLSYYTSEKNVLHL